MDRFDYINEDTYEFILEKILVLHRESIDIDLIKYLINKTCQEILIKTNRDKFPEDLKYLVIELVNESIELYKKENKSATEDIQSMSETGRTITFGASDTWKIKYTAILNKQLESRDRLINRYRLLYKVRCPYEQNKL